MGVVPQVGLHIRFNEFRVCRGFDLAIKRRLSGEADQGPRCNPRVHSALNKRDLRRRILMDISGTEHEQGVALKPSIKFYTQQSIARKDGGPNERL